MRTYHADSWDGVLAFDGSIEDVIRFVVLELSHLANWSKGLIQTIEDYRRPLFDYWIVRIFAANLFGRPHALCPAKR